MFVNHSDEHIWRSALSSKVWCQRAYKTCTGYRCQQETIRKGVFRNMGFPKQGHQEQWATTGTLRRTWCPTNSEEKSGRNLTREAAERPTVSCTEQKKHLTSNNYSFHVRTMSVFFMSGLWGRLEREALSQKNKKHPSRTKSFETMWQNVLQSDVGIIHNSLAKNRTRTSHPRTP